jgi:LmbE family N-acetylglucosaminyl deacetylase
VTDTAAGQTGSPPGTSEGTTAPIDFGAAAPRRSVDLPTPERVLAIGAHPDDVEFGCGATLAKWAAAGAVVNHLVCTDGSKGSWDPGQDIARLVAVRQEEQRAAAAALGASGEVVFLGWTDGELDSGLHQRWQVAFWIRKLRPTVVLGHDPWKRYRLHPDHRHAGLLAVEGIVAARDPHFFPEQQLPHHRPDALLLFEADEADHVEDVTGYAPRKLDALFAHRSQFVSTHKIGDDDAGTARQAFIDRIDGRLREAGALVGREHGEAFKLMQNL